MDINSKYTRSYATKVALEKALEKFGFADKRPVIVRNDEGRWTAIFGVSLSGLNGGYIAVFAEKGFLTIN